MVLYRRYFGSSRFRRIFGDSGARDSASIRQPWRRSGEQSASAKMAHRHLSNPPCDWPMLMNHSTMTELLRIPGDLANSPGSRWLNAGDLCFGEYHQAIQQKPRNVFVTEHTLIFVVKGAKIFRFPNAELVVESGKAIFLKRGCYMLCESVRNNDAYESISVFFNETTLRDFLAVASDGKTRRRRVEQGAL